MLTPEEDGDDVSSSSSSSFPGGNNVHNSYNANPLMQFAPSNHHQGMIGAVRPEGSRQGQQPSSTSLNKAEELVAELVAPPTPPSVTSSTSINNNVTSTHSYLPPPIMSTSSGPVMSDFKPFNNNSNMLYNNANVGGGGYVPVPTSAGPGGDFAKPIIGTQPQLQQQQPQTNVKPLTSEMPTSIPTPVSTASSAAEDSSGGLLTLGNGGSSATATEVPSAAETKKEAEGGQESGEQEEQEHENVYASHSHPSLVRRPSHPNANFDLISRGAPLFDMSEFSNLLGPAHPPPPHAHQAAQSVYGGLYVHPGGPGPGSVGHTPPLGAGTPPGGNAPIVGTPPRGGPLPYGNLYVNPHGQPNTVGQYTPPTPPMPSHLQGTPPNAYPSQFGFGSYQQPAPAPIASIPGPGGYAPAPMQQQDMGYYAYGSPVHQSAPAPLPMGMGGQGGVGGGGSPYYNMQATGPEYTGVAHGRERVPLGGNLPPPPMTKVDPGWNDPPPNMFSHKAKPKPKATSPAAPVQQPITHPIFGTAPPAEQAQQVPYGSQPPGPPPPGPNAAWNPNPYGQAPPPQLLNDQNQYQHQQQQQHYPPPPTRY